MSTSAESVESEGSVGVKIADIDDNVSNSENDDSNQSQKLWQKEIRTTRRHSVKDISARFTGNSLVETKEQCERRMKTVFRKIPTINTFGQENREALQKLTSSKKVTMMNEWSDLVESENIGEITLDSAKDFLAQYEVTPEKVDARHWQEWLDAIDATTKSKQKEKQSDNMINDDHQPSLTSSVTTPKVSSTKDKPLATQTTHNELHIDTATSPKAGSTTEGDDELDSQTVSSPYDDDSEFGGIAHLTPLRLPNHHNTTTNISPSTNENLRDGYCFSQLFISPDGQMPHRMDFTSPAPNKTSSSTEPQPHPLAFSPVFDESMASPTTTIHATPDNTTSPTSTGKNSVIITDHMAKHAENSFVKQDSVRRASISRSANNSTQSLSALATVTTPGKEQVVLVATGPEETSNVLLDTSHHSTESSKVSNKTALTVEVKESTGSTPAKNPLHAAANVPPTPEKPSIAPAPTTKTSKCCCIIS